MSAVDQADRLVMDNKQPADSTGPWHVAIDLDHGVTVHSHDGIPICRMGGNVSQIKTEANAHQIVDSVNAHDDLVKALQIARADFHACYVATGNEVAFSAYDRIDKALAKAGVRS
jgi:hypothetical protein